MKRTNGEVILMYLAEGHRVTAVDLCRLLGLRDRTVRAALAELQRVGLAKKEGFAPRVEGQKGGLPELWAWTGTGGVEAIDADTPADFLPLNPKTPDIREVIACQPALAFVWQPMREAA